MLNIDFQKLQNKKYLLKTRSYEKELAKDIGGEYRDRKLYDIFEGRTRYEVKKQLGLNWLDGYTCTLYYRAQKRYVMLWIYYDKETASVKEVYFVRPIELLDKLGFKKNFNFHITGVRKNFPQSQIKIPVKKKVIEEVAYKKLSA